MSTLGVRARNMLALAYKQRKHHKSSLILHYSPKTRADVLLRGRLEYLHFLAIEADPQIVKIDYEPPELLVKVGPYDHKTILDCELTFRNGKVVWREVKPAAAIADDSDIRARHQHEAQVAAAAAQGRELQRVTEADIVKNPLLLSNWRQVIPWIAACRHYGLNDQFAALHALTQCHGDVTLQAIQAEYGEEHYAKYFAAVFRLVQQGQLISDLARIPLSPLTRFWRPEVAQ